MAHLFEPFRIRDVTLRNRIIVSPMCQYSSRDGFPSDWHLVHLGSRAVGGAALVFVEASAVEPIGRISPEASGLRGPRHIGPFAGIARFVRGEGAGSGIQPADAGRKASTRRPWEGHGPIAPRDGGWEPVAPSPIPFDEKYPTPRPLS